MNSSIFNPYVMLLTGGIVTNPSAGSYVDKETEEPGEWNPDNSVSYDENMSIENSTAPASTNVPAAPAAEPVQTPTEGAATE